MGANSEINHREPPITSVVSSFGGAPWGSRFFLQLRWSLTPYWEMAQEIPKSGSILDLGCGHGLFPLALALQGPDRRVVGVDHDHQRIAQAQEASRKLSNLKFFEGSLHRLEELAVLKEKWAAITLIDVLHYFPYKRQEEILRLILGQLEEGGVLLFREVDPAHGIQSQVNLLHEKVMVGLGVTQADALHFRTKEDWIRLLQQLGLQVEVSRCGSFPFQDVMFLARKSQTPRQTDPLSQAHWIVADDWGFSPGVNEGILALAQRGIVRGVAIMVNAPHVQEGLADLLAIPGVKIGLHWVWDEPEKYELASLIREWVTTLGAKKQKLLSQAHEKMKSQLEAMQSLVGRVDFMNGHHHVHVLPGIPATTVSLLKSFGVRRVRVPQDTRQWLNQKAILNLFSIGARKTFLRNGLRVDPFFYPTASDWGDPERFRKKLLLLPPSEIIVHPAARDDFGSLGIKDVYRSERVQEFRILQKMFLASNAEEPS